MSRLEMLIEFASQNPSDPFPTYGLALEYKHLGQLEQAAITFAELIARHPDYSAAYLHAGNTLVALGRRSDARATYQAGITICQKRGDAHALDELQAALQALEG